MASTHPSSTSGQNLRPRAHATSTGKEAAWSTRRIALSALFTALALVLSFVEFPIFPAAPYLKYDPSGIVCLVAGLAFGPRVGTVVAVLPWLIRIFAVEPFGSIMGMACALAMTLPAALVYRRWHTRKGALVGLVVSAVVTLVVAILGNLLITPLYSGMSIETVAALMVPVLIPFNLIKIAINSVVTFAVYKRVSALVGQ